MILKMRMYLGLFIKIGFIVLFVTPSSIHSSEQNTNSQNEPDYSFIRFWSGTNPKMTVKQLVSYCAPVFWFSPDEPELERRIGKDIRIPTYFPFQAKGDLPVVYYQLNEILIRQDTIGVPPIVVDSIYFGNSVIDFQTVGGVQIDYIHYYRFERGLGGHDHDTEMVQFKIYIEQEELDGVIRYNMYLLQVIAKAHALPWYDNIYSLDIDNLDFELELPFHILVEEGKHASCTDMNRDGYYTPGYDVNVRTNDAWGLRDVIRTGELFSPEFKGWMAKVRRKEHCVLPPLPEDSPHRSKYVRSGVYSPENAVYELRPMPDPAKAYPDLTLKRDMQPYYKPDWPEMKKDTDARRFFNWWESDMFIESISFAFRANEVYGISFAFPLLIVKNVETPLVGGWLVNRIYLQDQGLRDFGYNLLYTPSASRFLDPYVAFGMEIDQFELEDSDKLDSRTDFVFETGIKIRANVKFSPLKFLSVITEFWGIRFGIKNRGIMDIDRLSYVFEVGAGVW